MNEIVMPKLSDTMTEGRLISWKKRVGESVQRGDVIAEVETDKANMELEAFTAGVLLETRAQPGDLVQVGTVIATIGTPEEKGAAQPAQAPQGGAEAAKPKPQEPPAAAPVAEQEKEAAAKQGEMGGPAAIPEAGPTSAEEPGESFAAASSVKPGGEGETQAPAAPVSGAAEGELPAQPVGAPPSEKDAAGAAPGGALQPEPAAPSPAPPVQGPMGQGAETRERAAPVVRRRARELGIELGQVKGSGPEGRILLHDLELYQQQPPPSAGAAEAAPGPERGKAVTAAKKAEEEVQPLPRLRGAIAKVVGESWHNIPHFTVTMEIAMDDAESLRGQLKRSGKPVTLNDFIVKGVALALPKFPQLNAAFTTEGMRQYAEVNIGVAVGVPDGVLVPVINGCDRLSLLDISQASHKLADRARAGALSEQEMSGGTFSVSNLGMYGVNHFTAIIYPSQSGVLAVGAVVDKLVLRAGIAAVTKTMKVTLSADHRLVDGAYAAEFLVELKAILENPVRLLI
jgi:pyruvate dehydrogenase E2 component (dihydrolipoamide acetyltransferase)